MDKEGTQKQTHQNASQLDALAQYSSGNAKNPERPKISFVYVLVKDVKFNSLNNDKVEKQIGAGSLLWREIGHCTLVRGYPRRYLS